MADEYLYAISIRYFQKSLRYDIKHVKKSHFSRHFGTLPRYSDLLPMLTFKKVIKGHFSRSLRKSDIKNTYHSCKSQFVCFAFFYLVTWDNLDLFYGHKAQEMLLTNVGNTIHADSLALFELVWAESEKLNILTLTWHVTSLVTPRSLNFVFPGQFFQGFQISFEFLESVQKFRKSEGGSK